MPRRSASRSPRSAGGTWRQKSRRKGTAVSQVSPVNWTDLPTWSGQVIGFSWQSSWVKVAMSTRPSGFQLSLGVEWTIATRRRDRCAGEGSFVAATAEQYCFQGSGRTAPEEAQPETRPASSRTARDHGSRRDMGVLHWKREGSISVQPAGTWHGARPPLPRGAALHRPRRRRVREGGPASSGSGMAEDPRRPVEDRPLHELAVLQGHHVVDVPEPRLQADDLVRRAEQGELVAHEGPEPAAAADHQHRSVEVAEVGHELRLHAGQRAAHVGDQGGRDVVDEAGDVLLRPRLGGKEEPVPRQAAV